MDNKTSIQVADGVSLIAVVVALLGIAQFFVCMNFAISESPNRFSISGHFLSDLGRTKNASAAYFNPSIIVLGTCLTVFFGAKAKSQVVLSRSGIVSSLGLIGIGLTPLDLYFVAHHVALLVWLLPMFILVWISAYNVSGFNRLNISLLLAIIFYVISAGSDAAPTYQKIVVLFGICWVIMICFQSADAAIHIVFSRYKTGQDRATQAYIKRLETTGYYSPRGRESGNQYTSSQHDEYGT